MCELAKSFKEEPDNFVTLLSVVGNQPTGDPAGPGLEVVIKFDTETHGPEFVNSLDRNFETDFEVSFPNEYVDPIPMNTTRVAEVAGVRVELLAEIRARLI
ncbi:MAG TPA: hypothetical protein VM492_03725 [Sumerlaeia bacterium]|nr:hypothetical protein [Sumerlaeia bacterium]